MAMLGKSLVFYLKYGPQMEHLYGEPKESGEPPDIEGLVDAERVLQMAGAVGDAACREVADFLFACANRVGEHFQALPGVEVGRWPKRSESRSSWR